jgi:hypothetical protein
VGEVWRHLGLADCHDELSGGQGGPGASRAEIAAHETFNYAILDGAETQLLGCVYIDPPDSRSPAGTDAVASWWVVDQATSTELERTIDDFVPRWLVHTWGFEAVHCFP